MMNPQINWETHKYELPVLKKNRRKFFVKNRRKFFVKNRRKFFYTFAHSNRRPYGSASFECA